MKIQKLIRITGVLFLVSVSLQAAVIPGRWEKMEATPVGSPIAVTFKAGVRIEGAFTGVSPNGLTISTRENDELTVAKSDIQSVSSPREYGDSVLNGTLLGLAAGVGLGVIAATLDTTAEFASAPGGTIAGIEARSAGDRSNGGIIGGAGAIGALMGFLIDSSHDNTRVRHDLLYRAP